MAATSAAKGRDRRTHPAANHGLRHFLINSRHDQPTMRREHRFITAAAHSHPSAVQMQVKPATTSGSDRWPRSRAANGWARCGSQAWCPYHQVACVACDGLAAWPSASAGCPGSSRNSRPALEGHARKQKPHWPKVPAENESAKEGKKSPGRASRETGPGWKPAGNGALECKRAPALRGPFLSGGGRR